ncbi:MAG: hypothetical protein KF702_07200 [Gammaproteobacteria bacterium]|nr:hypothetical protein [Gammaproteobacteria bacterium]
MNQKKLRQYAFEILQFAGIQLNGSHPWDIQIYNQEFYPRVLKYGSLGLGESYMDQWWDCQQLDQFFERVIKADIESKIKSNTGMLIKLFLLKMINLQTKHHSL